MINVARRVNMMKTFRRIAMMILLFSMLPALAVAQKGLHIAPYFDGRFNKNRQVVTVIVKGKPLEAYNLTLYRSLTFESEMPVLSKIESAVLSDATQAIDKETGHKDGKLLYGFYCLKPKNGGKQTLRYIFYRRTEKKCILVYMEGNTTLEDIKKMFQ